MKKRSNWQVILLPAREVAVGRCSLDEAVAWSRTYNRIFLGDPHSAVVARRGDRLSRKRPKKAG